MGSVNSSDTAPELAEFKLIDELFARPAKRSAGVLTGIGDDAAVTEIPAEFAGYSLVTATDLLVENTHFLPSAPPRSVGHRCLAVNLSDLAAMGAQPLWASLGLSIPTIDSAWLSEFAAGFFALADRYGVELIGGDTVKGPLSLAVTVQGVVSPGNALMRSGAAPGELLFVTGQPGHSAAGREGMSEFAAAFLYPEPKLDFAAQLVGLASAAMDISDGLHTDLLRLLAASEVAAVADVDVLPVNDMLAAGVAPEDARRFALFGGEDYELLFTIAADARERVEALAESCSLPLTCLGKVGEGAGLQWQSQGQEFCPADSTFRHF
jgi:thiamine-monophosphate kinase